MKNTPEVSEAFDNTNQVEEAPDEVGFDEDTLRYRVTMPRPDENIIVQKSIADNAKINKYRNKGKLGWLAAKVLGWEGKRVSVKHEQTGDIFNAQKAPGSDSWTISAKKIKNGKMIPADSPVQLSESEASKISAKQLMKKAVAALTNQITGIKHILDKAQAHEFNEFEVIDAEIGDSRREGGARDINFQEGKTPENLLKAAEKRGDIILHITKGPPPVFHERVDFFMKPERAIIQEETEEQDAYIEIGSNTYGKITATRNSKSGEWTAFDENNGYKRVLSANKGAHDVALELAQDKAFDSLDELMCEAHLRDTPVRLEEITAIEANGQIFVPVPDSKGKQFIEENELLRMQEEAEHSEELTQ